MGIYSDDSCPSVHRPWVSWKFSELEAVSDCPRRSRLKSGKTEPWRNRCLADSGGDPFSRLKSGPRAAEPKLTVRQRTSLGGPRWAMGDGNTKEILGP